MIRHIFKLGKLLLYVNSSQIFVYVLFLLYELSQYRNYVSPSIIKLEMDINDKINQMDAKFKTVVGSNNNKACGNYCERGSLAKLASLIYEAQPKIVPTSN